MNVIFQSAKIADEAILHELRLEFQAFESFPVPLDETANKSVLRKLLENENLGKVWLIVCDVETIGYVVLTFGFSLEYAGRDALIDELFLREQFRRQGIGKLTLDFIRDFCRKINVKAVHLEVEHKNTAALNLYRESGFIDHERYFLTKWID